MEKFRDLMMKFYRTSTQNQPLSEAQNSIFEKRLDQILPILNHTPDHPPYAWMIQKAIEEFGKKRGSSEKLISDHIKEKYKELPWAHDTLLNHHLKNLCVSGDIVLTKNQKYVFPSSLSDTKPSKKITKNKQRKAARKQYKVKKEDKDRVIAGNRPSCDPEGQHVLNEVPEGQDVLNEVPQGQDVLNEVRQGHVLNEVPKGHVVLNEVPEGQDILNEVCDMENVEICSSDTESDVPIPKGQVRNAEARLISMQRLSCDPGQEQSIVAVHEMQDASLIQEGKKLDTDQNLSDSPPGFDHQMVSESTVLLEKPQDFVVVAPELSCDAELKQVQLEVSDDDIKNQRGERILVASDGTTETLDEFMQSLEPITDITKLGMHQFECEKHLDLPTDVLYQQTIPDLKPTTDEKTCVSQSNPVCSSGIDQVRRIVCKYEFRITGKIAKENPTKKQAFDKCGPVIEQGQKQLDAQDSEPIDANERQLLPGSGKGLQTEGTAGEMQRKLLRSCNKSAKDLKPHVVVGDMHDDDKDSNELHDDYDDDDATLLKSEYRGRKRPRKVQSEEEEEEQQQIVEMESEKPKHNKKRGRGRPPNPKSKKRKVVIRNNDNPEIRRGRGRRRKTIIE